MKIFSTVVLLLMGMALVGCNDKMENWFKDGENKAVDQGSGSGASAENLRPDGTTTLAGSWLGPCQDNELQNVLTLRNFKKTQRSLAFEGSDFREVINFYEDDACTEVATSLLYEGQYNTQELNEEVSGLDLSYNRATLTAQNERAQGLLESISFCGQESWPVNEPVDITDRERGDFCQLPALPAMRFTAYDIQEGKLYLGGVTEAEERRPTEVDQEVAFERGQE